MCSSVNPKKRIGIMGGSFDPLHSGHLIVAQDAIEHLSLSEVVFVPAAVPPHKQNRKQVSAAQRFEMVQRAVEPVPFFSVSGIELNRGGVSYSIDTINALRAAWPEAELVLIIGSDTVVDLHNWYRIDDLLKLCKVATFLRPGEDDLRVIRKKIELNEQQKEMLINMVFHAHLIEISSTEIRDRVADGKSIHAMVPAEVEQYIYEKGLYRD